DGKLEVWIQCLDPAQYFGVAAPDLYLRAKGGNFDLNFIRGFIGIWAQMVLVTCFGVLFSTFLSGPVAMITTLATIITGFFSSFIHGVAAAARGEIEGGGPIEAMIRVVTHRNLMVELDDNIGTTI